MDLMPELPIVERAHTVRRSVDPYVGGAAPAQCMKHALEARTRHGDGARPTPYRSDVAALWPPTIHPPRRAAMTTFRIALITRSGSASSTA